MPSSTSPLLCSYSYSSTTPLDQSWKDIKDKASHQHLKHIMLMVRVSSLCQEECDIDVDNFLLLSFESTLGNLYTFSNTLYTLVFLHGSIIPYQIQICFKCVLYMLDRIKKS